MSLRLGEEIGRASFLFFFAGAQCSNGSEHWGEPCGGTENFDTCSSIDFGPPIGI